MSVIASDPGRRSEEPEPALRRISRENRHVHPLLNVRGEMLVFNNNHAVRSMMRDQVFIESFFKIISLENLIFLPSGLKHASSGESITTNPGCGSERS
jgi:hypothetical protein